MELWCAQSPKCLLITYKPLAMFEYFWSVGYFCVDGGRCALELVFNSITALRVWQIS